MEKRQSCHKLEGETESLMPVAFEEPTMASLKRPIKLLRSPPPSGRPSVTFSLVLEQEMDAGSPTPDEESCESSKKSRKKTKSSGSAGGDWTRCCSPTSGRFEDEREEGTDPRIHFLGFCLSVPLMECARFIGWLSCVPAGISLLLLPFLPSTMFELLPELGLLCLQLLAVLALFFGLQHRQPNYLRPFLFLGLLWNLALFLLLVFSLMELLVAQQRFCTQIWRTVLELFHGEPPVEESAQEGGQYFEEALASLLVQLYAEEAGQERGSAAPITLLEQQQLRSSSAGGFCWLGLGLVTVLGLAILLDGWLLNIVLLAHLHLKKAAKQESAKSGGQKWRRQTQDTAAGCCWLEELQSRQTSLGRRPPTPVSRAESVASDCSTPISRVASAERCRSGADVCGGIENNAFEGKCQKQPQQQKCTADKWSPMPESGNSERCRLLDNQVDEEEDEPDK